jgi:hypothetical protein
MGGGPWFYRIPHTKGAEPSRSYKYTIRFWPVPEDAVFANLVKVNCRGAANWRPNPYRGEIVLHALDGGVATTAEYAIVEKTKFCDWVARVVPTVSVRECDRINCCIKSGRAAIRRRRVSKAKGEAESKGYDGSAEGDSDCGPGGDNAGSGAGGDGTVGGIS